MASAATIGALRVVLGMDTAAFSKGTKGATKDADDMASKISKSLIALSTSIGGTATGLAYLVLKTINTMDTMGRKTAQAVGVSVEELSRLRHAADLSGVSYEALNTGIKRMSGTLLEIASGEITGVAARAFEALNVNVKNSDGTVRQFTELLPELADKFANMRDGATKTGIAMAIFGKKAGPDMIPLLNSGAAGIKSMTDEADQLGITLSTKTSKYAENFNDNMLRVRRNFDGIIVSLTSKLLPSLVALTDRWLELIKEAGSLDHGLDLITAGFQKAAIWADRLGVSWRILSILATDYKDSWFRSSEASKEASESIKRQISGLIVSHVQFMSAINVGNPMEKWAEAAAKMGDAMKNNGPAIKSTQDVAEGIARLKAELNAFMSDPNTNLAERIGAIKDALAAGTIRMSEFTNMMAKLRNDALKGVREEAKALFDDLINAPTVAFETKIQAINDALSVGTLKLKDYGKTMKKVNDENRGHWQDLASSVANALTTIFGKNKAASIAAAVINTAVAITKALQLPPPFGWAQAALIAATGAAQIATIKKSSPGGGGAAPSVRGGGANGDGSASVAPQQQNLFVQGINPTDLFRGDTVRSLAEMLLKYQKDGGKVVIT